MAAPVTPPSRKALEVEIRNAQALHFLRNMATDAGATARSAVDSANLSADGVGASSSSLSLPVGSIVQNTLIKDEIHSDEDNLARAPLLPMEGRGRTPRRN